MFKAHAFTLFILSMVTIAIVLSSMCISHEPMLNNTSIQSNVTSSPPPFIGPGTAIGDRIYIYGGIMDGDNTLTADQKSKALNLTLQNETIKQMTMVHDQYTTVINVSRPGEQYAFVGYMNTTMNIADVTLSVVIADEEDNQTVIHGLNYYDVLVDLNSNRVMSLVYSDIRHSVINASAIIPQGSDWYIQIANILQFSEITVWYEPQGATIYPMALNGTNMENLKKGKPYTQYEFTDPRTNKTYHVESNVPIRSGWYQKVFENGTTFFILKNNEKEQEVHIYATFH
jgi:hypothetical protein